jgi:hypothetical protein
LDGHLVNKSTFPLPSLGPKLEALALNLHQGNGFGVVRGVDLDRYGPEDNITLFLGLSGYVGEERGQQDCVGNMIGARFYFLSWSLHKAHKIVIAPLPTSRLSCSAPMKQYTS